MNLRNAWENFSNIYSSLSLVYLSVKRAGQVVNTVNHSLVLPELLFTAPKDFIYLRLHGGSNRMSVFFLNRLKIYNAMSVSSVNLNTSEMSKNNILQSCC